MKRLLSIVALVLLASCSGPDTREEPETVIGTPPSPKDDPFFFVAMPAEAVPAAATGTIGSGGANGANESPEKAADTAPRPRTGGAECFSCVRICPETVSDAECGDGYDTICGWGRSADRTAASQIATGECDAALDLARSGSRYSKITGACPAATCR